MQDPLGLGSLSELIMGQQQRQQPRLSFPEQEQLKCPRCDSTNTKFCYYNNYNLSQPRHFCKSCRRYWTKGGILRNIPVGGATRKTPKRTKRPLPDPNPNPLPGSSDHIAAAGGTRIFTHPNNSGHVIGSGHGNSDPGSGSASGETRNQESDCFFGGPQNRWPDLAIYTSPDSRFE